MLVPWTCKTLLQTGEPCRNKVGQSDHFDASWRETMKENRWTDKRDCQDILCSSKFAKHIPMVGFCILQRSIKSELWLYCAWDIAWPIPLSKLQSFVNQCWATEIIDATVLQDGFGLGWLSKNYFPKSEKNRLPWRDWFWRQQNATLPRNMWNRKSYRKCRFARLEKRWGKTGYHSTKARRVLWLIWCQSCRRWRSQIPRSFIS